LKRTGPSQVERIGVQTWEVRRAAHQVPRGAVVLRIDLSLARGYRPDWVSTPYGMCDAWGNCGLRSRRAFISTPYYVLTGDVALLDATTGALIEQTRLRARDDWGGDLGYSRYLVTGMVDAIGEALDQSERTLRVGFRGANVPGVEAAAEALRSGDQATACDQLERIVSAPGFDRFAKETRARVLSNLAWCLALGPGERDDATLARAESFARRAAQVSSARVYARAHARIVRIRADAVRVREQRASAARNFRDAGQALPPVDAPSTGR
ncbi:MAG: hypothetical protein KC417_12570, partial [Myxococcales bacterium]|nr:hypothetical protein [Myxococcales bacterium]